ncbi:MAG: hypothetical protein JEY99_16190 [Spirochaetales bacterium]|nr:hypothetical protein [Spirochaetales bacterium]
MSSRIIEKIHVFTKKGQYKKGEEIGLGIRAGFDFNPEEACLRVRIYHLHRLIHETEVDIKTEISISGIRSFVISILLPVELLPEGSRGFGCICELLEKGEITGQGETAFDLADSESPVLRYGFLCDFRINDRMKSEESLNFLSEFHMTHVQFYDWTCRHHEYKGMEEVYNDTMGKEIDLRLVKDEITGCRNRGMAALGYGAVYAAGEEYLITHPREALRDCEGEAFNLIDKFFIMDIREGSEWRKCLMNQYRYALEDVGFDGIHMDTYGFPKRAFGLGDRGQSLIYLEDHFAGLIDETRDVLGDEATLIFNNVGNWPVHATGPAHQDAIYIEVWDPYDTYSHIRQIIIAASSYKKPVILAAYLAPFRLEPDHGGTGSLYSALILHGAIVSLGASHLFLGEDGNALTQGYYNDYSKLRSDERERILKYYDFQVRYLDLFLDPFLVEISETHTAGENREYFFEGAETSADGRPGRVWTIVRESRGRRVISLINLTGQEESFWNRGKSEPSEIMGFSLDFPLDRPEGEQGLSAFFASPDINDGSMMILNVERVRNERGPAGSIRIKDLPLWSVIVLES